MRVSALHSHLRPNLYKRPLGTKLGTNFEASRPRKIPERICRLHAVDPRKEQR